MCDDEQSMTHAREYAAKRKEAASDLTTFTTEKLFESAKILEKFPSKRESFLKVLAELERRGEI